MTAALLRSRRPDAASHFAQVQSTSINDFIFCCYFFGSRIQNLVMVGPVLKGAAKAGGTNSRRQTGHHGLLRLHPFESHVKVAGGLRSASC